MTNFTKFRAKSPKGGPKDPKDGPKGGPGGPRVAQGGPGGPRVAQEARGGPNDWRGPITKGGVSLRPSPQDEANASILLVLLVLLESSSTARVNLS